MDEVTLHSGHTTINTNIPFAQNPPLAWHVTDFHDGYVAKMTRQRSAYSTDKNQNGKVTYKDVHPDTELMIL